MLKDITCHHACVAGVGSKKTPHLTPYFKQMSNKCFGALGFKNTRHLAP